MASMASPMKAAPSNKIILVWMKTLNYWLPAMLEDDPNGGERHLRLFQGSQTPSSVDIYNESDAAFWTPMLKSPESMKKTQRVRKFLARK